MAKDWAGDVKKFVPDADDGVIAGIVRYCGIALQNVDSSLVSYTDPVELGRVRENFLKKKLALTDSDEVLDAAIAKVGERMKGVNFKNRVTVYYLLLEHLGLTHIFAKAGTAAATPVAAGGGNAAIGLVAGAGAAVAAGAAASVGAVKDVAGNVGDAASAGVDAVKSTVGNVAGVAAAGAAAVAAGAAASVDAVASKVGDVAAGLKSVASAPLGLIDGNRKGGLGWLWWLLLGLLALALIWWFFLRAKPEVTPVATTTTTEMTVPAMDDANATAANSTTPVETAAIPDGAGIVSEMRDGKPVVKVYFDTAKADVVPAFGPAAVALKTYLDAHAGSGLGVSGYNDSTGNAAANAVLSKRRADAVKAALVAATIPETAIALVKPEASTDTKTTNAEARRVEVFIK